MANWQLGSSAVTLQWTSITSSIEDACAIEHNISPETYIALKQLLNERQGSI